MDFPFDWQNYTNRGVMREALPVAVKFLHKGNRELCRNVTCYLPLAAIENPDLLAKYVQPIADSVIAGSLHNPSLPMIN
jgi:hypothetical protein